MGSQILVAKIEPRIVTEPAQLFEHGKRVVLDAPTFRGIAQTGERIDDCVDVRRDVKAVKDRIIAGVADDRQFGWIDLRRQAFDQFGAAGAAGENDDHETCPGVDGVMECWSVEDLPSGPPFLTKPSASQSCSM